MTNGIRAALAQRFELFVEKLFRYREVLIQRPLNDRSFDFIATAEDEVHVAVEVKLYWSVSAPKTALRRSIQQLLSAARTAGITRSVLVINSRADDDIRSYVGLIEDLELYDYDDLWNLSLGFPELSDEFEIITKASFEFREEQVIPRRPVNLDPFIGHSSKVTSNQNVKLNQLTLGAELCAKLQAFPTGDGTQFETIAEEIIKYIFDGELGNWKSQRLSEQKLHRYDLIARVTSKQDFWNALVTDFRSRYIIFEFKNYAKPITQKEVYSTEKYLMPLAMRGTAILVTRKGADKNAMHVMSGALRESSKLILCISDKEMCEMLKLRDNGDDPTVILVDKLDDVLEGLER